MSGRLLSRTFALAMTVVLTVIAGGAQGGVASAAPSDGPLNSIGLRLISDPALGADARARLYIVDSASPGTSIVRRVEVSNTTAAPLRISLYSAAATLVDGTFVGADGQTQNELSSWTSPSPKSVIVASGGAAQATVTVDVPADAAPGEQYGVVWAQVTSPPNGGSGITQVSRVGLRMYVLVGPGGAAPADFAIESMSAARTSEGRPVVIASVRNTGGRALDISGSLNLAEGPGGLSAGPFPAEVGLTLAIGAVGTVRVVLEESVPTGPWSARLLLRSGLVERTATGTMTFPAEPNRGTSAWVWAFGALLIALVVGGFFLARHRLRTRVATQGTKVGVVAP